MAKTEEEWSAGVILFRLRRGGQGKDKDKDKDKEEQWEREYLLLQHREGHWDFPKGHIEPTEDLKEAACRELREETQIDSTKLIPGFQGLIEYDLERGGRSIEKRVIYFLGETEVEEVRLSKEHQAFVWFGYREALERLTYENSRFLLRQAEQFLKEKEEEDRSRGREE